MSSCVGHFGGALRQCSEGQGGTGSPHDRDVQHAEESGPRTPATRQDALRGLLQRTVAAADSRQISPVALDSQFKRGAVAVLSAKRAATGRLLALCKKQFKGIIDITTVDEPGLEIASDAAASDAAASDAVASDAAVSDAAVSDAAACEAAASVADANDAAAASNAHIMDALVVGIDSHDDNDEDLETFEPGIPLPDFDNLPSDDDS